VCCKSQQTTENSLDDVIPVDAVMLVILFLCMKRSRDNPLTYRTGSVFIPDQRAIILYMECQPLRSLCDYAHVGVLYTFCNISAAGFAMSSQLNSSYRQGRRYSTSYGRRYVPPITVHVIVPLPSPPARQGRTPCWVNSLRPSASVYLTHSGEYSDGCALVVGCDQRVMAQSEHKSLKETQAD
jgi:hypothetical protein